MIVLPSSARQGSTDGNHLYCQTGSSWLISKSKGCKFAEIKSRVANWHQGQIKGCILAIKPLFYV